MNILATELFETQLKSLLEDFSQEDFSATKSFKLYLDTIIINIPTKSSKYKKSLYFNDENIKDIQHEEYIIVFYEDKENETYLILSILKKDTLS